MHPTRHPDLLVGPDTADDAGVFRLSADLALVQTVDLFPPVVDDPYAFGQIAAANALSDVYAMGGVPLTALNIVGFPDGLDLKILARILEGGLSKLEEAGCTLVGGHSVRDQEPKYGLAVTGTVHPDRVVTNAGAKIGDQLVLTKPIGIGILTTALKRDLLTADEVDRVTQTMAALNREAAQAMVQVGVHACTDVTGFGLLGHLFEMATGSQVGFRVLSAAVGVLEPALKWLREGVLPGGSLKNRRYLETSGCLDWGTGVDEHSRALLCDAVTSGGLLMAVAPHKAGALDAALAQRGVDRYWIGEATASAGRMEVV